MLGNKVAMREPYFIVMGPHVESEMGEWCEQIVSGLAEEIKRC